jgi:hypothetical protein
MYMSSIWMEKKAVMKPTGRKKTLSLASRVALRVRRAVAVESFCCVRLKYYKCVNGQYLVNFGE